MKEEGLLEDPSLGWFYCGDLNAAKLRVLVTATATVLLVNQVNIPKSSLRQKL